MGPEYAHLGRDILTELTSSLLVFSKNEIVFARTSPQHKLEIGMLAQLCTCNVQTVG